jgi:hypothetical protein
MLSIACTRLPFFVLPWPPVIIAPVVAPHFDGALFVLSDLIQR